jgi:hypothetical protein
LTASEEDLLLEDLLIEDLSIEDLLIEDLLLEDLLLCLVLLCDLNSFGRSKMVNEMVNEMVMTKMKSLWSSPNQFGQTKTILFWSHRRTRQ